jgi:ribosomal-protein-alanine N-acetyltransferase
MSSEYIIITDRLGLRRWKTADEFVFAAMNQDPAVMEFFPRLLTPEETAGFIARIKAFFDETGFGLFAVEVCATREFIGYAGFARPSFTSFFTPCIEIGWRLRREAWGRGYATEAAQACLHYGFGSLRLGNIYSWTARTNTRSERVMQKIGMLRIGEFEHPGIGAGHVLRPHVLYLSENPFTP